MHYKEVFRQVLILGLFRGYFNQLNIGIGVVGGVQNPTGHMNKHVMILYCINIC